MSQQTGIEAIATPRDMTAGLASGCYLAQVRAGPGSDVPGVIYATRATAPATSERAAWFRAGPGESFVFRVAAALLPTWVAVDPDFLAFVPGATVAVALARTGA